MKYHLYLWKLTLNWSFSHNNFTWCTDSPRRSNAFKFKHLSLSLILFSYNTCHVPDMFIYQMCKLTFCKSGHVVLTCLRLVQCPVKTMVVESFSYSFTVLSCVQYKVYHYFHHSWFLRRVGRLIFTANLFSKYLLLEWTDSTLRWFCRLFHYIETM